MKCAGFYNVKIIEVQDDYEEYLGKGYIPPKKFGTIVCNHSTPVDTVIFGSLYKQVLVAKAALKDVFFLG